MIASPGEEERLVIIRFGHDYDSECMKTLGRCKLARSQFPYSCTMALARMDEILYSVAATHLQEGRPSLKAIA